MRRITKVAAITATAITAILATAGSASASVNVTDGVGFVGKGDVQTALGLANDAAMQDLFKSTQPNGAAIRFTASVDRVIADYEMSCLGSTETMHRVITQPAQMVVEAKPNTNKAGKLTSGWDLTGKTTGEVISVGQATMTETSCPAGSFPWSNIKVTQYVKGITGGLQVNGIPLPNTPVEVAPVA